jgi:hypothetical protein
MEEKIERVDCIVEVPCATATVKVNAVEEVKNDNDIPEGKE